MVVLLRHLACTLAASLLLPLAAHAQDLLVQKDYNTLSDEEQWKFNDVWCAAALDIAADTPGYNQARVAEVRASSHDEFIDGEGGSEDEFQANLAYATDVYRGALANHEETLDEMLVPCGVDLKAP